MENLVRLAELIGTRNAVTGQIAALIGRPAQIGHVGEYIASRIFGISLEESASQKGIDGHFIEGQLTGRSVNIKWFTKQDGLLDLTPDALPDFYLVLTGPKTGATSSRGKIRPWVIKAAYLFRARELVDTLRSLGVKLGVATSVRQPFWHEAEIYSTQRNSQLVLSKEQRRLLALFQGDENGA